MPPRAVLFDLDNTLVMEDAATFAAVRSTCAVASSRAGADADALFAALLLVAEKLAGTTLGRYFGAIVISCEVGFGKPDRRIFEIALERIGANAHETVMVGDSLARDVAGAHAAGIRAVWIDRHLWAGEGGPAPDARIESLSELPAALAVLAPPAASARGSRGPRPGSARGASRPRASRREGR